MTPSIVIKKPKCKKYTYIDHSKYREWEKERRNRFNNKLEELATNLPEYNKENPWKKCEILERSIVWLKENTRRLHDSVLQIQTLNDEISNLKKENAKIIQDSALQIQSLNDEIQNLKNVIIKLNQPPSKLKNILSNDDTDNVLDSTDMPGDDFESESPEKILSKDTNLAFVANIGQTNDHCYFSSEPEITISGSEEVVQSRHQDLIVTLVPAPQSDDCIAIVSDTFNIHPVDNNKQIIRLEDVATVKTIFVNQGSRSSVVNPMIGSAENNFVTTVNNPANESPKKIAIPRLQAPKRKKKIRKPYTRRKPLKKNKIVKNKDDGKVHDFPEDPLTNNEEMEIIEETIKEDTEQTENAMRKAGESTVSSKKRKVEVGGGKKKSKSSYSIAALCQLSVNIGDQTRPDVAQSPGMMSLASMGTISPANTPGPQEKTFPGMETCIMIDSSNQNTVEETVIEELRTIRPEDLQQIEVVTSSALATTSTTSTPASTSSVVSQSFISGYTEPVVSVSSACKKQQNMLPETFDDKNIQRDIYQVIKDLDQALETEKGKDVKKIQQKPTTTTKQSPVKQSSKEVQHITQQQQLQQQLPKTSTAVVSTVSTTNTVAKTSMSVYDFTNTNPTPPIPLSETRKDLKSNKHEESPSKSKKSSANVIQESPSKKACACASVTSVVASISTSQVHTSQTYLQPNFNLDYSQHPDLARRRPLSSASSLASHSQYPSSSSRSPYSMSSRSAYAYHGGVAANHHQQGYQSNHFYGGTQDFSSKYSCGHESYHQSDSRNYFMGSGKSYSSHPHYRSFHQTGDQNITGKHSSDRKRFDPEDHQPHSSMASGSFSVTHLVESNQRKSSKRSSTVQNKQASSKSSRSEASGVKEVKQVKDETRQTKSGRSKSGGRAKNVPKNNYSAESLLSVSGAEQSIKQSKMVSDSKSVTGSSSKYGSVGDMKTGMKTSSGWSDTQHFNSLSSLSPSPAFFPSDLSSMDFSMPILQTQDPTNQSNVQHSGSTNQKPGSKHQSSCQRAVPDWSLNTAILDNSFPGIPLPTLTPPNNDPAMSGDPMSGYSFMQAHNTAAAGWYQGSGQSSGRLQHQSYPIYSQSKSGHNLPPPPSQMVLPTLAGTNSQTGSLVNFNLSTIFPEINVPAAVAAGVGHGAAVAAGGGHTGAACVQNKTGSSSAGMDLVRSAQIGTPDFLPHSLTLFGHTSQTSFTNANNSEL